MEGNPGKDRAGGSKLVRKGWVMVGIFFIIHQSFYRMHLMITTYRICTLFDD
jgi:hypothetical protein